MNLESRVLDNVKETLAAFQREADTIGYLIPDRIRVAVHALGTSFSQELFAEIVSSLRRGLKAHKAIRQADAWFDSQGGVLSYSVTTDVDGIAIEYSRAVHTLTAGERLAIQFGIIAAGVDMIGKDEFAEAYRAILYGSGKGTEIFIMPYPGANREEFRQPRVAYIQRTNPVGRAEEATAALLDLVHQCANDTDSDDPLVNWARKKLGLAPVVSTATNTRQPSAGWVLPLGLVPETGKTHAYQGERSLVTIAPPGSGKSQCHVIPALLSYQGPAIVLDVKGECYAATSEWRRHNVGPVLRYNPVEPEISASYNPFALVDENPDILWEDARLLVDLMAPVQSSSEPGWELQGREVLTLIVAFVVALHPKPATRLSAILDLLATIGLQDMFDAVGADDSPFPSAMKRTARRFASTYRNAPKQFEGILSGVTQHTAVWEGPKVERVTSTLDWHPLDFRKTPFSTLYLCIPPNALDTYAPLLRVIIGQHIRILTRNEPPRETPPLLFLLDEMPRLGAMAPIREALEVGRSYRIILWMFAQYIEQLRGAYGDAADGMVASCGARLYMNPSWETAERISKEFGTRTDIYSDKERENLKTQDIISPAHRDSIFLLAQNEQPQILRKRMAFENRP